MCTEKGFHSKVFVEGEMLIDKISRTFLSYATEILGDTNKGLTGAEIVKYCNNYAIDFNVDIPISTYDFGEFGSIVPNKRTALLRNLEKFSAKQQFFIISELCDLSDFKENDDVARLKKQLYKRYGNLAGGKISDKELIIKTEHWLEDYQEAYKLYRLALQQYEEQGDSRNILDNMRLSLELFLKEILRNNKSLENQYQYLGGILEEKGISKEVRNLFIKIIEYYAKYQNEHVKHNNSINDFEVEYIVEQTSIMMNLIVKAMEL